MQVLQGVTRVQGHLEGAQEIGTLAKTSILRLRATQQLTVCRNKMCMYGVLFRVSSTVS